jgi:hypothetical protein
VAEHPGEMLARCSSILVEGWNGCPSILVKSWDKFLEVLS